MLEHHGQTMTPLYRKGIDGITSPHMSSSGPIGQCVVCKRAFSPEDIREEESMCSWCGCTCCTDCWTNGKGTGCDTCHCEG